MILKKYELTHKVLYVCDQPVYRIKALMDIPNIGIKAGDFGGYIHSEANLSQDDECWVFPDAMVYDDAKVTGNAKVFGNARIFEHACISGNAVIKGPCMVYGYANVSDEAVVTGNTKVWDSAVVRGKAHVYGYASIYSNAFVGGEAEVFDLAKVSGFAVVEGSARVYGQAVIVGRSTVRGKVHVNGNAVIRDELCDGPVEEKPTLEAEPITRKDILTAAEKCVCGHRVTDYGKPENNFGTIAQLWTAYLRGSRPKAPEITAEDVAMLLALLKVGRISSGTGSQDCFVDLAGYAACAGEIAGRKA